MGAACTLRLRDERADIECFPNGFGDEDVVGVSGGKYPRDVIIRLLVQYDDVIEVSHRQVEIVNSRDDGAAGFA